MDNLGKQIKIMRITKDLTQKQLADMLGVGSYIVSNIEKGRTEPDIEIIKKLCVIFDITSDELLGIETESQRRQVKIYNSFNGNGDNNKINF